MRLALLVFNPKSSLSQRNISVVACCVAWSSGKPLSLRAVLAFEAQNTSKDRQILYSNFVIDGN